MATHNWPGFGIASVSCSLDRPATVNRSSYTGVRSVATNPWHGKWSFKVQLATMQGDGAFQAARAFFTSLKGQVDNFHLPAVEAPQNTNTGVTIDLPDAAAGATSFQIKSTVLSALVVGNMITVNGQLLSLTAVGALTVSGGAGHQTVTFEPPLRAAAPFGTSVETAKPYALVALSSSDFSWDIGQWRRYGLSFDCDEAIGDTDSTSSAGDVWNASFTSSGAIVTPATINLTVKDEGSALGSVFSTLNFVGAAVTATDAGSGQANITITASSGDETIYLKDHGIVADNTTINSAAAVEALIAALPGNRGAVIHGGWGVTKWDRHIRPDRPYILDGYGRGDTEDLDTDVPTCFLFPRGKGGLEFYPVGVDSWVKNMRVGFYGTAPSDGVATYSGSGTTLSGVSPTANFANDDTVLIEGMGPSIGVVGTAAAIASASNVATIVTTALDYLGNTAFLGNPGVYVGQRIRMAGAGAAGADLNGYVGAWTTTTITNVNASGAAVNAATSVTAALYTIWMPVITKIVSGGGTATPTFDHFPISMSAVTGAPMRHTDVCILARTKVNTLNVCCLPQGSAGSSSAGGGIGLLCSGITTDGSVADNGQHYDIKCQGGQSFAGIYFQGDDAQLNAFHGGDGSGPKLSIGEASFLGNYFYGFAVAFNVWVQIGFNSAETQFHGGYGESGSRPIASNQSRAVAYSVTSMRGGSGITVFDSASIGDENVVLPKIYTPQLVVTNGLAATGLVASFFGGNVNFTPPGYNGTGIILAQSGTATFIQSFIGGSIGPNYQQASIFHFGSTALGSQFGTLDANAFDHPAEFRVNGTKVIGPRATGWTAATGTPARGAFAAAAAGTASATYVQSELQGALNRIAAMEARFIALEADARAHGLIN